MKNTFWSDCAFFFSSLLFVGAIVYGIWFITTTYQQEVRCEKACDKAICAHAASGQMIVICRENDQYIIKDVIK